MHHKQNNKESKTYVQGLRPFGNTLPRGLKGILKKNGYNYSEIISKWNLLVGKQIANFCYPKSIKMTKNNKNGILNLAVERGNEIDAEYAKKDIINKINAYFGYKLIGEVRLQNLNVTNKKTKEKNKKIITSKKFTSKIEKIKNEEIRNSLLELLEISKK